MRDIILLAAVKKGNQIYGALVVSEVGGEKVVTVMDNLELQKAATSKARRIKRLAKADGLAIENMNFPGITTLEIRESLRQLPKVMINDIGLMTSRHCVGCMIPYLFLDRMRDSSYMVVFATLKDNSGFGNRLQNKLKELEAPGIFEIVGNIGNYVTVAKLKYGSMERLMNLADEIPCLVNEKDNFGVRNKRKMERNPIEYTLRRRIIEFGAVSREKVAQRG